MNHFQDLDKKLDTVERLAQSGKLTRLFHNPLQYISAQFFRTVMFPLTRKGVLRQALTFMDYPLSVLLPSGTDIYLTGGKTHDSEIRLARFLIQYFEGKGSEMDCSFVDIGAHIGYFSLLASFLVDKKGQVYAFEAAKGTFKLLKQNLENRSNIQVFHQALTDTEKDLEFYEFPVLYSEYNTLHVAQFEKEAWFQKFQPEKNIVRGMTLDVIFEKYQLKNPVVKIDTEGAEAEVIAGAKNVLKHHNPVIIMEFLSDKNKNAGHYQAFKMLRNVGFQPFYIGRKGDLVPLTGIEQYFLTTKTESDNFVFMRDVQNFPN